MEIRKRKAELRNSLNTLSGEELDKAIEEVDALTTEETDINQRMADAEDVEKRGKAFITPAKQQELESEERQFTPENVVDAPEYRTAFLKTLQGKKTLTDVEKRALTTAVSSVGAVIPTVTMNKIVEKLEQQGVIYPLIFSFAIPSNVKIPVEGETEDFSWVDEGADGKNSDDTIGSVSLTALELIKNIEITAHVEAMSIDAFEGFVVALLARKARKAIDYAIINGNGEKQGLGIVTALEKSKKITNTADTEWSYDDIIDLKRSLKSGYRQNAKFVMSSTTLGMVEKIKDKNGRPIFKDETDNGTQKLSGKPVIEYDNVPDGMIIFGDFEYYYFNFVKAFEIAKDTSVGFKSGKTCYRAMALCDGKPALEEAFVVKKKVSASSLNSGVDYKDICSRLEITYSETDTDAQLQQKIRELTMTETLLKKLTVPQLQAVASDVYSLTLEATTKDNIVAEILQKITA